jgi:unsaturated rhamnogalacturonyl hydrolase
MLHSNLKTATTGIRRSRAPWTLLIAIVSLIASCSAKSQAIFSNWPAGTSPAEVGRRVADHFVQTPSPNEGAILYQEICLWYGALTFADVAHNPLLRSALVARFDPLFDPANKARIPDRRHVDFSVFGALPLELYILTKQERYRTLGLLFADRQWENPTEQGLTPETRFWIDDMYMITILQVQAYRATGDRKYIDRAAVEMAAYLDKLQQPNGLFYHAPDVPFFWGRGDGWVAAGMTELLKSLPADNPNRPRILAGYRKMMEALVKFQAADGMWHQLIDHPEAWPETSSTGMFTGAAGWALWDMSTRTPT